MNQSIHKRRPKALVGGLIEFVGVMALAGILLVGFVYFSQDESEDMRSQAVASHLQEVVKVARAYLKFYGADVTTAVTGTGSNTAQIIAIPAWGSPCTVGSTPALSANASIALSRLPCLHDINFWPSGLQTTNPYNQTYILFLRRRNTPGTTPLTIEAVLLTYGGERIPTAVMTQVVSYAGTQAGFYSGDSPYNTPANRIYGAFGTWFFPVTAIPATLRTSLTQERFGLGHLAFYLGQRPLYPADQNWVVRRGTGSSTMTQDLNVSGQNLTFTGCSTGGTIGDAGTANAATTCKIRVKEIDICSTILNTPVCATLKRVGGKPNACRDVTDPVSGVLQEQCLPLSN